MGSPRRCRPPRCDAGLPKTRSNPGCASPGSSFGTRNFAARAAGSLTCLTGSGTGNRCHQTTISSPPTTKPPSNPGAGGTINGPEQDPDDAGQPRLPPRRRAGLPGRLRRPPGQDLRSVRRHDRHRTVHPNWSPQGEDPGAVHIRRPPCSGSSTSACPTKDGRPSTGSPNGSPTRSWCTPGSTLPGSTRWGGTQRPQVALGCGLDWADGAVDQPASALTKPSRTAAMIALARLCAPSFS
jgi:hypothetical protein